MAMTIEELSDNMVLVLDKLRIGDSKSVGTFAPSKDSLPNTVAIRDVNSDVTVRSIRFNYPSQSVIPDGSSVAFRVNSDTDPMLRVASRSAVINWLGRVNDSDKLFGKTIQELREELRFGLVPTSTTINGHRLDSSFNLNAADVGLGNVPNYPAVSGVEGQSTTLLATQKAAYDASSAPNLEPERKRRVTFGTSPVSGLAEEGEIYIQI